MSSVSQQFNYLAASTAMIGLQLVPLTVLGVLSCATFIRHRADPSRIGLSWLLGVFSFAALASLFLFVFGIISLVITADQTRRSSQRTYTSAQAEAMIIASVRLSSLSVLFQRVADILLIITFVELSTGFLYALNGQKGALRRGTRYASFGVGGVLLALALAWTGLYNAAYTAYYSDEGLYRNLVQDLRTTAQLSGAFDIVQWIISGLLIALTAVVVHKYRKIPAARTATVLLLVAAVLSFVRWMYYLIYDAIYLLPEVRTFTYAPFWVQIVDVIFNQWLFLVAVALLYALGAKKHGGLWSTAQPWTASAPIAYAPAQQPGFQYGPPQQPGYNQYPPQPMPYQQPGYQYGSAPPQMHMQQQPYVPPPGQAPVYQPATQPHAAQQVKEQETVVASERV